FDMRVRHGQTAAAQGWHTVAVESLQEAVRFRPEANDARLSLVHSLISAADYAKARVHLDYLRQHDARNPGVQFALAHCLASEGEVNEAAKLLDQLLAAEPDNWTLLSERGWVSLELDRPTEAEPYLRKAQFQAPHQQIVLARLANCLSMLGK